MKRTAQISLAVLGASSILYWLGDGTYGRSYWLLLAFASFMTLAGLAGIARHRRGGSAATVKAWSARSRRRHGVASTTDIFRVASATAARRKGPTVRPSLGVMAWDTPTTEVGVRLCKVGSQWLWTSLENVVTVFGAPRTGKTGWICGAVIDAPGAVVTTSTRLDVMETTAQLRARDGRPVHVFNPGGVGDVASTIGFNPLQGCEDPLTATYRATDMIPSAGDGGDGERWDAKARLRLAVLLHAAAVAGLSCSTVASWIAKLNDEDTERTIYAALRRSPEPEYCTQAKQLFNLNDKTQTSITDAMMPAFAWLIDPAAVAATIGPQLDIEALIASRGTIYLLGRHEGHTAPLLAALTGHIARTARRLAPLQPGRRLDPPLTLVLDECARIAPVPLPDWSADMGGSGICIIAAFQSLRDMFARWGETGAGIVLTNSGAVLVLGGAKDAGDLEVWTKLAGERDEPTDIPGRFGKTKSSSVRKAPVLPVAQIANLPTGRCVVFHRGMPVGIGKLQMAWKRSDVRRAQRTTQPVPVVAPPVMAATPVQHVAPVVDIDSARKAPVA
jgi:type IV secretion system protein VirD4